jgi:hypothetical protein
VAEPSLCLSLLGFPTTSAIRALLGSLQGLKLILLPSVFAFASGVPTLPLSFFSDKGFCYLRFVCFSSASKIWTAPSTTWSS